MLINGIKFACNTCIKGHRSSSCNHVERPLFEIRKKGRPVTQCAYCRDLRKTKQIHIKCSCTDKSKNQCYQCPSKQSHPSLAEDHGASYNDIILSSSTSSQDQSPMQCTSHETAKTLLSGNPNNNNNNSLQAAAGTPGAVPPLSEVSKGKEFAWLSPEKISSARSSIDDSNNHYVLQRSHSSSLRFLDGQAKSPRRRSSLSRKYSSKKSSCSVSSTSSTIMTTNSSHRSDSSSSNITENRFSLNQNCASSIPPPAAIAPSNNMLPNYSENEDAMFLDIQTFDYGAISNQQFITEADPAEVVTVPATTTNNTMNHCNRYIPCSSDSITSTPSSSVEEKPMMYEDFNLTNTDPDELTTLLNNVLNAGDNRRRFGSMESSRSSVDMTRTSTTSSSSGILAPRAANICGSLIPHTNCCPPVDTQGQSVVITITPLSSLFTEGSPEQQNNMMAAKSNVCSQPTPMTRIVTCYCGNACTCPGCFVHPDNYFMCQFPTTTTATMPIQPSYHHQPTTALSSSTSSSYSSDDEDHNNYSAYTTSTFV